MSEDGIDGMLGGRPEAAVPDQVSDLLVRLYRPEAARAWLMGHNSHLDGARPIDLLAVGRERDVVDALRIEIQSG